jgi:hypothetical protein
MIYAEYIQEYDFWGHCDIDIVWGHIRSFIDESILQKYQIISSRPGRISGHFCLYRNQETINKVFLSMPKTIQSLGKKQTCERLDEDYFSSYLQWLEKPTFLSRMKQAVVGRPFSPRVYWEQVLTTSGKLQRYLYKNPEATLYWQDGRAYYHDGTEMMYLHFHELKNTLNTINFSLDDAPNSISISTTDIIGK